MIMMIMMVELKIVIFPKKLSLQAKGKCGDAVDRMVIMMMINIPEEIILAGQG